MHHETDSQCSKEQIASALRLVGAGVPVADIEQTMGVTPGTVSAWKREYAALLGKLIRQSPVPDGFKPGVRVAHMRRIGYMSDGIGNEEVEGELQACKIRYSVVDDAAGIASKLLRSGKVLGNLQITSHGQNANRELVSEKRAPEAGLLVRDWEQENSFILVNAQLTNPGSDPDETRKSAGELTLLGSVTEEIDELRWWSHLGSQRKTDEPIIQGAEIKYTLDALLDTWIDGLRAFYTSSIDALLLGRFLILKSEAR